jgi:SAM-dependent methyltransferase
MKTVDTLLTGISQSPHLWNILRFIVENGFRGEKAIIEHELAPWRDVGSRDFLDLGCGTGAFAACFPPAHYVGVDLSSAYVRFAGRHRGGHFLVCDGTLLALESQRFDAALVLGVLHHLPDAVVHAVLGELHRVLRPGATALVMEDIPPPGAGNLPGHLMHWLDRGGYIRTEADYRAFFDAGFETTRTETMRSGICDYGVYVLRRNP